MSSATVTLNDGTVIPTLAFGSGTAVALSMQDASVQLEEAINAGFRHLDTAQMYRNEHSVGKAIAESGVPRSELFITTKLDKLPEGKTVKDTLRDSLRDLRLDYVDLFLLHMPVDHPDLKQTWKEIEECKEEGLAKSIGVSNCQPKHFEVILSEAKVIPSINQVCRTIVNLEPHLIRTS